MSTTTLTQLGAEARPASSPEEAVLETVPYVRREGPPAIVRFSCPEFTSLCPVTGQPDFATLVRGDGTDEAPAPRRERGRTTRRIYNRSTFPAVVPPENFVRVYRNRSWRVYAVRGCVPPRA